MPAPGANVPAGARAAAWQATTPAALAAGAIAVGAYWAPRLEVLHSCSGGGSLGFWCMVTAMAILGAVGGLRDERAVGIAARWAYLGAYGTDVALSMLVPEVFRCSHNLLPFEFGMLFVGVQVVTRAGALAGSGLRRWARVPPAAVGGSLAAAAGLVVASAFLLEPSLRANEQRALDLVREDVRAQWAYREHNPEGHFACRWHELHSRFSSKQVLSDARGPYENAYYRSFRFRLRCDGGRDFTIEAEPLCVPDCGEVSYCAFSDGTITTADYQRNQSCLTGGRVVERLRPPSAATPQRQP